MTNLDQLVDNKAEASIISTLLYHPEFLGHSTNLKTDHFYQMENKLFYWAIKELYQEKKVTSITATKLEMMFNTRAGVKREFEKYNIKSLQEYIDLANYSKVDDIASYKMFVKRVLDLSIARDVIKNCERTTQDILAGKDVTVEKLNSRLYKDIQEITTRYTTDGEIKTIGEVADETWEAIEKRKSAGEMNGFPSIFPSLKSYFLYQKQEMVLVGARMKTGKSIFGMLEAIHAAQNGVTTLVYDSEMSDKLYFLRMLSFYTGIPALKLENEQLTGDELNSVAQAREKIRKLPLYHIFNPSLSLDQLYSVCYQYKIQASLQFVVYDYIKGGDELESSTRSNAMGKMADFLKNKIGGELDLAVLAFAQIGRSGEFAESDALERYCSVSCSLFKKTPEQIINDGSECGTMGFLVKLSRLGPSMMSNEYLDLEWAKGLTIQEAKRHDSEDNPL